MKKIESLLSKLEEVSKNAGYDLVIAVLPLSYKAEFNAHFSNRMTKPSYVMFEDGSLGVVGSGTPPAPTAPGGLSVTRYETPYGSVQIEWFDDAT